MYIVALMVVTSCRLIGGYNAAEVPAYLNTRTRIQKTTILILILFFQLRVGLSSDLFSLCFPTKVLYALLI